MQNPWGMEYSENGLVSRNDLYIVNDGAAVKQSPDAPSLAICIPTRGDIPIEVFMAFKRMGMPINMKVVFFYARGLMGSSGRDKMTKEALAMGAQYLMFFDDDILPPADAVYKMMMEMQKDETIGLITGVYTTKTDPPHPHIYKHDNDGHYWGFSLSPYDPPEDIWGCGAGCLLVRAQAIREMEQPYWSEATITDENHQTHVLGHDLHFCYKVRKAGFRTVVDGSVQCDHFDRSSNKYYRLPRNCEPVRKFREDKRNDAYWLNWWGVNPSGDGSKYAQLLELISAELDIFERKDLLVVGSGGGAIAQAVFNMYQGNSKLLALTEDEIDFARQVYLPYVSNVGNIRCGQVLVIEPNLYDLDDEKLNALINQLEATTIVVISGNECRVQGYSSMQTGAWHVAKIGVNRSNNESSCISDLDWCADVSD